jgi:hypothetical protein
MTSTQSPAIGEIIEVSTTSFIAQCVDDKRGAELKLLDPPQLGAFVKIASPDAAQQVEGESANAGRDEGEVDPFSSSPVAVRATVAPDTIFAVVSFARMTSLDAGRRPTAMGFSDEDQIRLHQPQVFELITTEFSALLIGYSDGGGHFVHRLPPRPPRLHGRVTLCTRDEIAAATDDLGFLRRILQRPNADVSPEDLAAAVIRQALDARDGDLAYLRSVGARFSEIAGIDYGLLQRIIEAVVD